MKLARIEYVRPETEQELLFALALHGARAAILAGGQSLIPQLALRSREAQVLIDINRLRDVPGIGPAADGGLVIGPLNRHRDIAEHPILRVFAPMLATAALHVGNPEVRNRGTFCGSIAFADPAGEFPLAAVALGATVTLKSVDCERAVAAEDFFTDAFTTSRRSEEFIASIRVDASAMNGFHFFDEIAPRPTAPALSTLALFVPEHGEPRLAVGGVQRSPWLLHRTSEALAADPGDLPAIRQSLRQELGALDPYHLHLATTLLERACAAWSRHER